MGKYKTNYKPKTAEQKALSQHLQKIFKTYSEYLKKVNMKTLIIALLIPAIASAQVDPQIIWTNPDGSQVDITETVRPSKNRLYPDGVSDEDLGLINPNRSKVIIDQRVDKPLWPRINQPILAEPKWWDKTEE